MTETVDPNVVIHTHGESNEHSHTIEDYGYHQQPIENEVIISGSYEEVPVIVGFPSEFERRELVIGHTNFFLSNKIIVSTEEEPTDLTEYFYVAGKIDNYLKTPVANQMLMHINGSPLKFEAVEDYTAAADRVLDYIINGFDKQ